MVCSKIVEITAENLELYLETFIDDGLAKDIPIVGNIFKVLDIASAVKDKLFAAKIAKFLQCLAEVPEEDAIKLKNKMLHDSKLSESISKKILLVIDKQSDIEKSDIIANLFIAYLDKKLSELEFRRCLDLVETVFLDDLLMFINRSDSSFSMSTVKDLFEDSLGWLINTPLVNVNYLSSEQLDRLGRESQFGQPLYESSALASTFKNSYMHGFSIRSKKTL